MLCPVDMETVISNLGSKIQQDRDPYANLAQCAVLWAQLNSLKALVPNLETSPQTALTLFNGHDFSDGYFLLPRCKNGPKPLIEPEINALKIYWDAQGWSDFDKWPKAVARWACLRLPNGQRA